MGIDDRRKGVNGEQIEHPQEECRRELDQCGNIRDAFEDIEEVGGEDDVVLDENMKGSDHDLRRYHKPGSWDFLWRFDDERRDQPARGDETI